MFCPKCGKEVFENADFCSACGSSVGATQQVQSTVSSQQAADWDLLKVQLSSKVKTQAMIWLIIGLIQVLIYGPLLIYVALEIWWEYPIYGISVMAIGIANICFSIKNFEYSKTVLIKPVGVVEKYKPIGGLICNLIYNLFLGGILGVFGSIYAFVLRSFVVNNSLKFREMEKGISGEGTLTKQKKLLKQLSGKIRIQAIINLFVGVILILLGVTVSYHYIHFMVVYGHSNLILFYRLPLYILLTVIGIINLVLFVKTLKYSGKTLEKLVEIQKKCKSKATLVRNLIYKIFSGFFAGLVIGFLFDLLKQYIDVDIIYSIYMLSSGRFLSYTLSNYFYVSGFAVFLGLLLSIITSIFLFVIRGFVLKYASELNEIEEYLSLDNGCLK